MFKPAHPAELSMAGKIRTKEKCPKCGGAFTGTPLSCVSCLTTPRRYYIDIYVIGKGQVKLYSDRQGHPLDSYARASRVIESIRYEIDRHSFDPTKYIKADIINYLLETRIEAWYQSKYRQAEKGNLASSYTMQIKRYLKDFYLPYFKGQDVREVRTYHIEQFYEQMPDGLSLKYQKNILDALRNFFATLHRQDYIKESPAFPRIIVDRKAPRWIDRNLQFKAIEVAPVIFQQIFAFLMFQGLRPGEAIGLKVKDLDLNAGVMHISRTFSASIMHERVKSKIVRPRAINPMLLPMLGDLCKDKHPEAYVFVNSRGKHFTENNMHRAWVKTRKALGLNDVTFYQATRHSMATNAFKDGADLKSIGDILGHTDIRTTLKYAHSDVDNQRAVFQRQSGTVVSLFANLKK